MKLFYPFIGFYLPIYWVLKSVMVRVWSLVINLMVKRYITSSRILVLLIQSIVSKLSLFESQPRSQLKTPSEEAISNSNVIEILQC